MFFRVLLYVSFLFSSLPSVGEENSTFFQSVTPPGFIDKYVEKMKNGKYRIYQDTRYRYAKKTYDLVLDKERGIVTFEMGKETLNHSVLTSLSNSQLDGVWRHDIKSYGVEEITLFNRINGYTESSTLSVYHKSEEYELRESNESPNYSYIYEGVMEITSGRSIVIFYKSLDGDTPELIINGKLISGNRTVRKFKHQNIPKSYKIRTDKINHKKNIGVDNKIHKSLVKLGFPRIKRSWGVNEIKKYSQLLDSIGELNYPSVFTPRSKPWFLELIGIVDSYENSSSPPEEMFSVVRELASIAQKYIKASGSGVSYSTEIAYINAAALTLFSRAYERVDIRSDLLEHQFVSTLFGSIALMQQPVLLTPYDRWVIGKSLVKIPSGQLSRMSRESQVYISCSVAGAMASESHKEVSLMLALLHDKVGIGLDLKCNAIPEK